MSEAERYTAQITTHLDAYFGPNPPRHQYVNTFIEQIIEHFKPFSDKSMIDAHTAAINIVHYLRPTNEAQRSARALILAVRSYTVLDQIWFLNSVFG